MPQSKIGLKSAGNDAAIVRYFTAADADEVVSRS
jgi:hypothetical protein